MIFVYFSFPLHPPPPRFSLLVGGSIFVFVCFAYNKILLLLLCTWRQFRPVKWVCDHRSESQFKQSRKSPKKRISGLQRENPRAEFKSPEILFFGLFRDCLNCDSLRWSHTHFICIPAFHIISFWISTGATSVRTNGRSVSRCAGARGPWPSKMIRTDIPCISMALTGAPL